MKLGVDQVGYGIEIIDVLSEAETVDINDQQLAVVVFVYPFLIALVEAGEVVDADAVLIFASAFVDVVDYVGNAASQLYKQVGRTHQ